MAYVNLFGFSVSSGCNITALSTTLDLGPAANNRLLTALANPADYTRLVFTDGIRFEIVRVTAVAGVLVLQRGQEGTVPIAIPCGGCVSWQLTTANMQDFIAQFLVPNFCGITSNNLTVTPVGCQINVDQPNCVGASWRSGNQQLTQDASGCISSVAAGPMIADGVYPNATITVQGGNIVAISPGTQTVYGNCGECP